MRSNIDLACGCDERWIDDVLRRDTLRSRNPLPLQLFNVRAHLAGIASGVTRDDGAANHKFEWRTVQL